VNKNAIPFDVNPPLKPSGVRIGTPRDNSGMKEPEMRQIAHWIAEALHHRNDAAELAKIAAVLELAEEFRCMPSGGQRRRRGRRRSFLAPIIHR